MFRTAASRLLRPTLVASASLAAATTYTLHRQHDSTPVQTCDSRFQFPPNFTTFPVALSESPSPSLSEPSAARAGVQVPGLPTISASEVRQQNGRGAKDTRVYVGYGLGVYDVTEFVGSHPGGDYIMRAAGGPLEPHWRIYGQHNADWVVEILEEFRVGNLTPDEDWEKEVEGGDKHGASGKDAWGSEPVRDTRFLVQGENPFNAEPSMADLVKSQLTPNELFYVRNHMPVPEIAEGEYELTVVDVDGEEIVRLSLQALKAFPKAVVAATVQCAGNRRNELNAVKKVKGGKWEGGAISNAEWGGARLSDVLAYARSKKKSGQKMGKKAKHVCFEGLDADAGSGTAYAASIPIDIIQRVPDVLLAYEMNGETLPRDHGYPVRAIVPGVVGARCVKWLGRVVLSEEESKSHWQQQDYRSFSPDIDWDNVDFSKAPSIQEMPVVSTICETKVERGTGNMRVSGYAWSGDGKEIIRVDVSGDGGKTWKGAVLREKGERKRNECYDWTLWDADVEMVGQKGKVEVVCKAIDSSYNTQPERAESVWNLRGLLNNSWHRVEVKVE